MAFLGGVCTAGAHLVPDMTVEAGFDSGGNCTLRINVDPRTFLAADPTSLPPVPASWYRDQTPAQVAATHERAQEYLASALGLLFDGQKIPLPACRIQAMDGADNTPLKEETQEVHLLATAKVPMPAGTRAFQIDFAKNANTSLILLLSQEGETEPRPRVVFAGETSPPFHLRAAAAEPAAAPQPSSGNDIYLIGISSVVCVAGLIGWRLLCRYRHHHRAHRRNTGDSQM